MVEVLSVVHVMVAVVDVTAVALTLVNITGGVPAVVKEKLGDVVVTPAALVETTE